MKKYIRKLMHLQYLPKWIILSLDLLIIYFTFFLSNLMKTDFRILSPALTLVLLQSLFVPPIYLFSFYLFKTSNGIIRHITLFDASKIFYANIIASLGIFLISFIGTVTSDLPYFYISYSVIIDQFIISIFLLIGYRFYIKLLYHYMDVSPTNPHNILIYGAGDMGMITRLVISQDDFLNFNVLGFIDDNIQIQGKLIGGLPVYSEKMAIEKIINQLQIKEIIFAINKGNISQDRKSEIINHCLEANIKIREVPEASQWINGKLSTIQIKEINIEDLLSRDPILLDKEKIGNYLLAKTVLVTGAAGSIGSEMVRQLICFKVKRLILIDNAESPLFTLQNDINPLKNGISVVYILGNVTDVHKIEEIFNTYHPEIIFHAAAYKHVPIMEEYPYEAIKCNVGGLKIMADLCIKYNTEKFVMISTDKAVNPTNVMGASKRICEIYIQALSQNNKSSTKFITTRFGNVLGSNGSVIPIFKQQIKNGGPIQVTHKEITRFFMTIPEACQLVMEAGFMGNGGEIYLFDMGKPVKIYELAEKLIILSGFVPHKDIAIEVIGLRPGEKLFEELLTNSENSIPTHHKQIMIGKVNNIDFKEQKLNIEDLLLHLQDYNEFDIVDKMKNIVPEFISKNSRFEISELKPDLQKEMF